jgi:excisionase family DNA binding protein
MENFYTTKDVAKLLGYTTRHVIRLCLDGTIKGVKKFGKSYAIPKQSVDTLLKAKKDGNKCALT